MLQHFEPLRSIGEYTGGKIHSNDFTWCRNRELNPAFFEVIFQRLPRQLKRKLKPLSETFLLELVESCRSRLQRLLRGGHLLAQGWQTSASNVCRRALS